MFVCVTAAEWTLETNVSEVEPDVGLPKHDLHAPAVVGLQVMQITSCFASNKFLICLRCVIETGHVRFWVAYTVSPNDQKDTKI